MATILLRRLCFRSNKNNKFYNKLSNVRTQRTTLLSLNIKYLNKVCYNRRQVLPSTYIFCQNFSDLNKTNKKDEPKKLSLFQKFKQMYRDYWYVLVPVHVITSIGWFSSFYYLAKSGVDIVVLLESWHVSEVITNPLRDSSMGYVAVSYALYKIFTPLRYTVTLGGTTVSINYLKKWGYIKPVPSAQKLKSMYTEKRDNIIETVREKTGDIRYRTEQFKEKKDEIIEDIEKRIKLKIEDSKDQIKEKKNDILKDLSKPLKIKSKD